MNVDYELLEKFNYFPLKVETKDKKKIPSILLNATISWFDKDKIGSGESVFGVASRVKIFNNEEIIEYNEDELDRCEFYVEGLNSQSKFKYIFGSPEDETYIFESRTDKQLEISEESYLKNSDAIYMSLADYGYLDHTLKSIFGEDKETIDCFKCSKAYLRFSYNRPTVLIIKNDAYRKYIINFKGDALCIKEGILLYKVESNSDKIDGKLRVLYINKCNKGKILPASWRTDLYAEHVKLNGNKYDTIIFGSEKEAKKYIKNYTSLDSTKTRYKSEWKKEIKHHEDIIKSLKTSIDKIDSCDSLSLLNSLKNYREDYSDDYMDI